jgi:FKBP-type peptidyl-prolyl cis-trans isomerase 2
MKLNIFHIIAIVAIVAILAGVIYIVKSNASSPQVVVAGDTVQVNYTGTFTNGTVFDSSAGKTPLEFTVGANQVIPGFNNAVIGMKLGEEKNVTIDPNNGYGNVNPELIMDVPRSAFGNQSVDVGMYVSEQSGPQGVITAANSTNVTVDFNPPLAGKTLLFNIKVVGIQKGNSSK